MVRGWWRRARWLVCVAGALALATGCTRDTGDAPTASVSGLMLDSQLAEISGLAASIRHPGTLWMHDDGGNPERLFAVDRNGDRVATFRLEGVPKTDWEDIAAFRHDGRDYLLVADTGDNGGLRRTLQLHAVEEPARLVNARLRPAWSVVFQWPDGPRDCEAVAVDAAAGEVLLVSKKRQPPELFSVPLHTASPTTVTATLLGHLRMPPPLSPQGNPGQRAPLAAQVTAADISPDGNRLAVMTYRYLLVYTRHPGEPWGRAVARPPVMRPLPWLAQAEAMGWARDGRSVFVTGEFVPAPLYRIVLDDLPPVPADERH